MSSAKDGPLALTSVGPYQRTGFTLFSTHILPGPAMFRVIKDRIKSVSQSRRYYFRRYSYCPKGLFVVASSLYLILYPNPTFLLFWRCSVIPPTVSKVGL